MIEVNSDEIQRDLSRYLRLVEAGETIIIKRADKPIAEFKPMRRPELEPRPSGLCAGEFVVPDDFNAPLPDEVLATFEN